MPEETSISKSECQQIIFNKLKNEDFEILKSRETPFGKVNGFLGEHLSLEITIKRNQREENHRFFVKKLPTVPSQRNFLLEGNGCLKEKWFFTTYLDLLKKYGIDILNEAVAVCYYTDGKTFVFEDLTLSGYTTLSSRKDLDLSCIKLGLQSMAKMHASAIILEEKASIRLVDEFPEEFESEVFHSGKPLAQMASDNCKRGMEAIIDLSHKPEMLISKEEFKKKAFQGQDEQKFFSKPAKKYRNTLCHGDLWTNNIMFKFEEDKPVNFIMVDFQSIRYTPPAQDVVMFLYLNTNREFREKHMEEMLRFYYKEFSSLLDKHGCAGIVTEKAFFESCQYSKQFSITQTCTHVGVIAMNEKVASDLLADPDRTFAVLFEDKYDFVVDGCAKDEDFKRINFEKIADLREFYEQKNSV